MFTASTASQLARSTERPTRGAAVGAGARAALIALVGAFVVLAAGRLLGADLTVTQPGAASSSVVGPGMVAVMVVAPVALGTLALLVAQRWGTRGWNALAWLGLAIGVASVSMPLTVEAGAGTKATLALMHVVVGVVWFTTLRRTVARADD